MNKPIAFVHSADFDGHCSGAIIHKALPGAEIVEINYGQPFPWDQVQGRDVVMADFSLQPWDGMEQLARDASSLLWIDHHASAISEAEAHPINCIAILDPDKAACELTWEYFFPDESMPRSVRLLGRFDVWDHSDPDVLAFQFGMSAIEMPPTSPSWDDLLTNDKSSQALIDKTIAEGRAIYRYVQQQNSARIKSCGFESTMDGLRAICCNTPGAGSLLFDAAYSPSEHDVMLSFYRTPKKRWKVGLYSTKPEVHCGEIAKRHGGGGHPGAAGFECDQLPFEY